DIPDLVRFFVDTRAVGGVADVRIPGGSNDLRITRPGGGPDNFQVVLQEGGSAGGPFAHNTPTITLHSDTPPPADVKNAVQGSTSLTVAFISHDPSGVNDGSGTVTVSKLKLYTPDFSKLFDHLDICSVISGATGPLLDGLDKLLGSIQDGLNSIVSATK